MCMLFWAPNEIEGIFLSRWHIHPMRNRKRRDEMEWDIPIYEQGELRGQLKVNRQGLRTIFQADCPAWDSTHRFPPAPAARHRFSGCGWPLPGPDPFPAATAGPPEANGLPRQAVVILTGVLPPPFPQSPTGYSAPAPFPEAWRWKLSAPAAAGSPPAPGFPAADCPAPPSATLS